VSYVDLNDPLVERLLAVVQGETAGTALAAAKRFNTLVDAYADTSGNANWRREEFQIKVQSAITE
jgi:hypothetical protein